MAIIYSKKIEWIRDYVDPLKSKYPRIDKLKSIRSYSPNASSIQHSQAHIIEEGRPKIYKITLNLYYYTLEDLKYFERKKMPYSKIDLLTHLAHELAHLYYWDHCPRHKILESKFVTGFMKKLLSEGYVSEEEELKAQKGHSKKKN